jgi:hypothetical protein
MDKKRLAEENGQEGPEQKKSRLNVAAGAPSKPGLNLEALQKAKQLLEKQKQLREKLKKLPQASPMLLSAHSCAVPTSQHAPAVDTPARAELCVLCSSRLRAVCILLKGSAAQAHSICCSLVAAMAVDQQHLALLL